MIVVDTNVVAYLLIEGDRTADAQALRLADPDWRSEPFLLVQFSNLLATQVRAKALSAAQAQSLLESAAQQVATWVEVPHAEVLTWPSTARSRPTTRGSSLARADSPRRW